MTLRVSVKVRADAAELKAGLADGEAAFGRFDARVQRSGQTASLAAAEAQRAANAARALQDSQQGVARGMEMATRAAAALGVALSVDKLIQYADAWKQVEGRLKLVTSGTAELRAVQEQLFEVAQRTRQSFEATADTYARFARSTRGLPVGPAELLRVVETINQAVAVSGGSSASAEAALFQLGQAMAAGALRGEELNSVLEQTPRLAEAIAAGMGVTTGELKTLAEQNKLTAEAVLKALLSQGAAVAHEFNQLEPTVSAAATKLSNAVQKYVGEADRAAGATRTLASGLDYLAENLPDVVTEVERLGILLAGGLVGAKFGPVIQGMAATASATKMAATEAQALRVETARTAEATAATAAKRSADVSATLAQVSALKEQAARQRDAATAQMELARGIQDATGRSQPYQKALHERNEATRTLISYQRLERELVAEAAAAAGASATADAAAAQAQAAVAAGVQRTSIAVRAATAVQTAWNAALAFVGGPVGAAILAVAGAVAYYATRTTDAERAQERFNTVVAEGRKRIDELRGASQQRAAQIVADQRGAADAAAREVEDLQRQADELRARIAASGQSGAVRSWLGIGEGAELAHLKEQLAEAERRAQAAAAALEGMRSAVGPGDASWAEWVATLGRGSKAISTLTASLSEAQKAAGLTIERGQQLSDDQAQLAKWTADLTTVIDAGVAAWSRYRMTASQAANVLEAIRLKLDPVRAAVAGLNAETNLLRIPEGFERDFATLLAKVTDNGKLALSAERIQELRQALADNTAAKTGDRAAQTEREAAGNRLLAGALTDAAKARAQNRIALAEEAAKWPELGAATANAILTTRDLNAVIEKLPPDLRRLWAAMDKNASEQLAGSINASTDAMSRQARQALELAAATRQGGAAVAEAELRHAIENETLQVGAGQRSVLAQKIRDEFRARKELAAAQFDRDLDLQIESTKALANAEALGAKAVADATIKNQIAAQIEREGVAADSARAKAIAAKTEELAKWQQQQGYNQEVRARERELDLLQAELALMGTGEEQRARILDLLRYELELRDKFPEKADEEIQALVRKKAVILDTQASLRQQKALSDEIGRLWERAFDRIGSALTEAFAQGKAAAINWGSISKAIISELIQAAIQLALINPIKNWMTGGSAPTIWAGMGGGAAPVAGGGVTGTLTSAATNWGMSKAGGWALDKLGFGTGAGGIGLVDKVGMSLGFGAPTIASGAMTAGYVAPTVMVNGAAVPVSAEVAAGHVAMLEAANAGTTGTLGAGVSSSLPALSSLFTAAGAGAFGGMFGGMIGTAANSKAVGGLSGAALGLGATGAYAAIMGMSAIGGPIGLAIGAIVGGIMGMLGTAKKSSGPNGGANVRFDNGVAGLGASGADNGGDVGKAKAAAEAASATFNAIVKLGGGSVNKSMTGAVGGIEFNDQKGTWTSLVSDIRKDFSSVEEAVSDFAKRMVEALTKEGNLSPLDQDVATALKNSKATSPDKLLEDIGFAKTFRSTFDQMRGALNPLDNQIKEWTTASKELGEQVKTNLIDWRAKAIELKLATEVELTPALLKGMDALMGIGPAVEPLRGMAAVTKRAEIEFEAFKPALEEFGLTAAQIADKLKQYVEKAKSNALEVVGETQRVGTLSLVSTMDPAFRMGAGDLLKNLGLKPETLEPLRLALDTLDITARGGAASTRHVVSAQAALNQALLDGLVSGEQYQQLIAAISTSWASSQAASNAMLRGRLTLAQLINPADKPGGGDLLKLAGIDPAKLQGRLEAPLDSFLSAARAGTASAAQLRSMWAGFDAELRAGTITVDAYSQALSILSDAWQEQTQQLEQVAAAQSEIVAGWSRVANEALAAVNSLRMDAQLSTLGPKARVDEGERLVEDAYRRFQTAADDNERQQAWSDFNSLWRPYLEASREYYADQVEYNRRYEKVIQEQQAIASYAGAQASMAQQQLDVARQSLETLRSINAKSGGGSAGGGGVPASNSGPGEYYGAPGGRYKWVQHPDGNWSIEQYATGAAALGQGVYHRPTKFRELGERGPEAIMPLANIGGRLGIHAVLPSTAPTDLGPVVAAVGGATGAIMEVGNLIAGRLDILIDGVDELRREVAEQRRVNRDLVIELQRRAA